MVSKHKTTFPQTFMKFGKLQSLQFFQPLSTAFDGKTLQVVKLYKCLNGSCLFLNLRLVQTLEEKEEKFADPCSSSKTYIFIETTPFGSAFKTYIFIETSHFGSAYWPRCFTSNHLERVIQRTKLILWFCNGDINSVTLLANGWIHID